MDHEFTIRKYDSEKEEMGVQTEEYVECTTTIDISYISAFYPTHDKEGREDGTSILLRDGTMFNVEEMYPEVKKVREDYLNSKNPFNITFKNS